MHAKGKPLADGINLETLARRTPGFTGADLANLMNEAALLSARRNLDQIGMMQLDEAIDRVLAGPERRSRVMSEHEKRVIVVHESGHALVARVLPEGDDVHKVSIVARGPCSVSPGSSPRIATRTRRRSSGRRCRPHSAGGRRRSWCSARSRPAPRTTSRSAPRSRRRW